MFALQGSSPVTENLRLTTQPAGGAALCIGLPIPLLTAEAVDVLGDDQRRSDERQGEEPAEEKVDEGFPYPTVYFLPSSATSLTSLKSRARLGLSADSDSYSAPDIKAFTGGRGLGQNDSNRLVLIRADGKHLHLQTLLFEQ
jgi:hypothetical protein